MKKLVSICIPLYNSQNYILDTIKSILSQDYEFIEVIICDDRSTDNSFAMVASYLERNPKAKSKIKLFQNEKNLGMVPNWNRVVELACGEYIKNMGGDDLLEPDCISKQVAILEKYPELPLVFCKKKVITSKGKYLFSKGFGKKSGTYPSIETIYKVLKIGGTILGEPVTGLFRKADFVHLKGYDDQIRYHADYDLWLRLMLESDTFYYLDEPLVSFRIHRESATSKLKNENLQDFWKMFYKFQDQDFFPKINPKLLKYRVLFLIYLRDIVIRIMNL
ncbi:MAG: glycosyltransferase [Leptospiraceae bacterium]|nr:glycosyltransferase [Leptospiraceae bacterium]MCP5493126.1 glycosyltransferase [Leptospiraceae bacterium]